MYLLIRGCGHLGKTIFNQFTSHYVSINSYNISYLIYEHENKFTSHYVSINSADLILLFFAIGNLHPTMYLLIRITLKNLQPVITYLHPTMYLLILFAFIKSVCYYLSFTSHYVSINSVSIPSL